MATKKKSEGLLRGAVLVKKAIEAAKANGTIAEPEPVAAGVLKKLRLPNDEKLSPALKELLSFDASFLGWEIDDEEPELEPVSLDEWIEQEFGEEQVSQFGEAIELLGEDCIPIGDPELKTFLYVGTPDDKGEYPTITLSVNDGCWVSGFVPFDVWIAQKLGVSELPTDLEALCKALADANGDGRVNFKSETREFERDEDEDEDEDDEDEDDDDDEDKPSKDGN
jgi:hypothetical protein